MKMLIKDLIKVFKLSKKNSMKKNNKKKNFKKIKENEIYILKTL